MHPLTSSFFTHNRQELYKQLQPSSMVALAANLQMQRNADMAHRFEQESNFWYLTGINKPGWWLLADVDSGEEWLVAPHIAEVIQTFDGSLTAADAMGHSGITQVLDTKEGRRKLAELVAAKQHVCGLKPLPRKSYDVITNPAQQEMWRRLDRAKQQDIRLPLARQRAIKQPVELQAMQQAIDITIESIREVLRSARQHKHEYQVEAQLDYEFRRRGATVGFDTIVAAGANACTIHHMPDGSRIHANDWLLFDVGAQVSHYTADISRTVPLGQVTPRQQSVYEALVRVHDHVQSLLNPGQDVREFLQEVDNIMMHELVNLGLMKAGDKKAYRTYFPHAIGHGLGLDAHDPLGRPEVFAENMVMTIEPGIYIPAEGIGMRIESVALLAQGGAKLLSGQLPIELTALQKMMP